MAEEPLCWYVLRMTHGRELRVRDRLLALGVEHFIPTQKTRGARGRSVEKPLVNCLGFVRATKTDALDLSISAASRPIICSTTPRTG